MFKKAKLFAVLTALAVSLTGVATAFYGSAALAATPNMQGMNWFGGPVYDGKPNLEVTAALVDAGGGVEHFSFQQALVSMLGEKTVHAEVGKLTKQYGSKKVNDWIAAMDFYVTDGLKHATAMGINLPTAPADLKGATLAKRLVSEGTDPHGVFWAGWLFDHLLSHDIHDMVMADLQAVHGLSYDENGHRITNQAMYDVAQALGLKKVKLASLHCWICRHQPQASTSRASLEMPITRRFGE
ncbi:conserved hypothetical protein, secreted [mine drainage metagenome]|uniref:Uncharacterized protein n=3 Tax=mine drainage metagenome TaxID=410659 RepID=T0YAI3_9ZZZZ